MPGTGVRRDRAKARLDAHRKQQERRAVAQTGRCFARGSVNAANCRGRVRQRRAGLLQPQLCRGVLRRRPAWRPAASCARSVRPSPAAACSDGSRGRAPPVPAARARRLRCSELRRVQRAARAAELCLVGVKSAMFKACSPPASRRRGPRPSPAAGRAVGPARRADRRRRSTFLSSLYCASLSASAGRRSGEISGTLARLVGVAGTGRARRRHQHRPR